MSYRENQGKGVVTKKNTGGKNRKIQKQHGAFKEHHMSPLVAEKSIWSKTEVVKIKR